jgi:hypothetical protein
MTIGIGSMVASRRYGKGVVLRSKDGGRTWLVEFSNGFCTEQGPALLRELEQSCQGAGVECQCGRDHGDGADRGESGFLAD